LRKYRYESEIFEDSFTSHSKDGRIRLSDSEYIHQLKMWLGIIKRSQLLIINTDSLLKNATDAMSRIFKFLNIPQRSFVRLKLQYPSYNFDELRPHHAHLYTYFKGHNDILYHFMEETRGQCKYEPPFILFTHLAL
jgi:hypothetical protein